MRTTAHQALPYSVDNAAWDCAGADKVLAATVDGKPGTVKCSTVFAGESFKSAATIKDECDKTAGTSGTGSCSSDGSTGKAGCILSSSRWELFPSSSAGQADVAQLGVYCIDAENFGTDNADPEGTVRTRFDNRRAGPKNPVNMQENKAGYAAWWEAKTKAAAKAP